MLLIKYSNLDVTDFIEKYSSRVFVPQKVEKTSGNEWLIKYISDVKNAISRYDIILVDYLKELILSFDALKLAYSVIYPSKLTKEEYEQNKIEYDNLKILGQRVEAYVILENKNIFETLQPKFDWIEVPKSIEVVAEVDTNVVQVANKETKQQPNKALTLKDLVENDDIEITDNDIRDMKAITNKFKIAMILQAKSRLKTVLKFCNVLDKLYEELVNRIDDSLATADTASLMYTADYISKALSETNQFIMPLINNEKLQNFFIVDNSSVININNDRVDVNTREKIRKATEIVLDNLDYFVNGEYENIVDPNSEENQNQ